MNLHHIILSSPWETLYNEQCLLLVFHYKEDYMGFLSFHERGLTEWLFYQTRKNLADYMSSFKPKVNIYYYSMLKYTTLL